MKRSIGDILGVLVDGNITIVPRILDQEIIVRAVREGLLAVLRAVEDFCKFRYPRHVGVGQDACHNAHHALLGAVNSWNDGTVTSTCPYCMSSFQILQ